MWLHNWMGLGSDGSFEALCAFSSICSKKQNKQNNKQTKHGKWRSKPQKVGGLKFGIWPWKSQNRIKIGHSSSLNHQPHTMLCVTRGRGVCKVIKHPPPNDYWSAGVFVNSDSKWRKTGWEIKHRAGKIWDKTKVQPQAFTSPHKLICFVFIFLFIDWFRVFLRFCRCLW